MKTKHLLFALGSALILLIIPPLAIGHTYESSCEIKGQKSYAKIITHDSSVEIDGKIVLKIFDRNGETISKHVRYDSYEIAAYSTETIMRTSTAARARSCMLSLNKAVVTTLNHHPHPDVIFHHEHRHHSPAPDVVFRAEIGSFPNIFFSKRQTPRKVHVFKQKKRRRQNRKTIVIKG